jgi:hypothetical protein
MNNKKEIDLFFLENFFNELIPHYRNKHYLINKVGDVDNENGYNTYFLTPYNKYFKKINLYFEESNLRSVTIFANFDFRFNDLVERYGQYREHYSYHDDLYLYFFNENNEIPYFIEYESKIRPEVEVIHKMDLISKIKIILKQIDY